MAGEFGIIEQTHNASKSGKVSEETKENIQNFYLRPGMTVWNDDRSKENLSKHFMFLREAFGLYPEQFVDTDFDIH